MPLPIDSRYSEKGTAITRRASIRHSALKTFLKLDSAPKFGRLECVGTRLGSSEPQSARPRRGLRLASPTTGTHLILLSSNPKRSVRVNHYSAHRVLTFALGLQTAALDVEMLHSTDVSRLRG